MNFRSCARVRSFAIAATLSFAATVAHAAPPPNDNFADAILLTGTGGDVSVTVIDATYEVGEPRPCKFGTTSYGTAWYKWIAPANGQLQTRSDAAVTQGISCAHFFVGSSVNALLPAPAAIHVDLSQKYFGNVYETIPVVAGQTYYIQASAAPFYAPHPDASFSFAFTQPPVKLVAAVLPTARSVQVGSAATAYGTMINTGSTDLYGCAIGIPAGYPASLAFGVRDSTGATDLGNETQFPVAAGGVVNLAFAITATAPINSQDIPLIFDCVASAPAVSVSGLDTFLLSASPTPVPDLVSIGTTLSNDGIANIAGNSGNGLFVASAVNIGAADTITATVDDNGHSLPVNVTLCRSNPATGACTNPQTAGASSTFTLASNEIATFSIFLRGTGALPFDPANNRLFLRFKTADGVTRGATSVAVRTQ